MDSVVSPSAKRHHHECYNWCAGTGGLKMPFDFWRDVTLGEDACQTRTGLVPSLLAQLNSTVLSLMDRAGVRNVARQMRYFDASFQQALALVLTGHCSVY